MTMVVGVFESLVNAQDAAADLIASGYSRHAISVLVRNGVACGDNPDLGRGLARCLTSL
jgi:hypothetical protein